LLYTRQQGVTLSTDLTASLIVSTVSNKANDAMVVPSVDQLGTQYMIVTCILYTGTPAGTRNQSINQIGFNYTSRSEVFKINTVAQQSAQLHIA